MEIKPKASRKFHRASREPGPAGAIRDAGTRQSGPVLGDPARQAQITQGGIENIGVAPHGRVNTYVDLERRGHAIKGDPHGILRLGKCHDDGGSRTVENQAETGIFNEDDDLYSYRV